VLPCISPIAERTTARRSGRARLRRLAPPATPGYGPAVLTAEELADVREDRARHFLAQRHELVRRAPSCSRAIDEFEPLTSDLAELHKGLVRRLVYLPTCHFLPQCATTRRVVPLRLGTLWARHASGQEDTVIRLKRWLDGFRPRLCNGGRPSIVMPATLDFGPKDLRGVGGSVGTAAVNGL